MSNLCDKKRGIIKHVKFTGSTIILKISKARYEKKNKETCITCGQVKNCVSPFIIVVFEVIYKTIISIIQCVEH